MRIRSLLILVFLVLALVPWTVNAQTTNNCPSGTIALSPGQDIQAAVDSAGVRAVFCLNTGLYERQSITPKDDQQFIAIPPVVFDGLGTTATAFNGVVEPDNPTRNAEGVRIRGIDFINYRTSNFNGVGVLIPNARWVIEDITISDSTSAIMGGKVNWTCAGGFVLRDVLIENVSHAAIYWNARNGLVERVTVRDSGFSMGLQDAGWLGIVKWQNQPIWTNGSFNATRQCALEHLDPNNPESGFLVIQDSTFQNLNSVGWWCDINCGGIRFRRNVVRDNRWNGVMYEISGLPGQSIFENNLLVNNRRENNDSGAWGGGEFFFPNATNVIVRNNRIVVGNTGRAFSLVYEQYRNYPFGGITIENNEVWIDPALPATNTANHHLAVITQFQQGAGSVTWRGNRYYVRDLNGQYFSWQFRRNFSSFVTAAGETGTILPYSAPPVGTPAPVTSTPAPNVTPTSVPPTPLPPTVAPPVVHNLPGLFQAESFWNAYDATVGDFFNLNYRLDYTDVDIKRIGNSWVVGLFDDRDWLEYRVRVNESGPYALAFFGGAVNEGRALTVLVDGVPAVPLQAPLIPAWDGVLALSATVRIDLSAGEHTIRVQPAPGFVDVDYFVVTKLNLSPTATPTNTATQVPLPTATDIPPTNTPVPPTETLIPPTNTPEPTATDVPLTSTPEPTATIAPTVECYRGETADGRVWELCFP